MPPALFDNTARAAHRRRAMALPRQEWFLHNLAAAQITEKLADINRQFSDPVIIGWQVESWASALPISARLIPDSDLLDLRENSCDLIIHALCLHSANDPVGQLVQMRRALRPDGLMLAVLFGGQTLHQLRSALAQAESDIEGGLSPRIAPMAEIREWGGLLQRAGFALPVADGLTQNVSYANVFALMSDLRAMGETNILIERRQTFSRRDTLERAQSVYAKNFGDNDNRISASFELIFLTGWSPAESQQKPLRPGSAKTRLAEALGVTEYNPEQ